MALLRFLITLCTGLFLSSAVASPNPSFIAICEEDVTHGYRAGTDLSGSPMPDEWTTDEEFGAQWKFHFDGIDRLLLDGERMEILSQRQGLLFASEKITPGVRGTSVWTYAIHLQLEKIVASEVQADGGTDDEWNGIKARAIEFVCDFDIDWP